MPLLVHAEIHGLVGRDRELRELLQLHAERLGTTQGNLAANAYEPLGGHPGSTSSTPGGRTSARCARTTERRSTPTTRSGSASSSPDPAT